MKKYKITTDGISGDNGVCSFDLECTCNPFKAVLVEFERLLKLRGLEFPEDLVCKNGEKEIVFEYSFLEANEFVEKVQLIFKVQKQ